MNLFSAGVAGMAAAGKPVDLDRFEPIKRKPKPDSDKPRKKHKPRRRQKRR